MKLTKFALTSVLVLSALGLQAHAATTDQGHGVINFKGSVVDSPCNIDTSSTDQTVDFGQLGATVLNNTGTSPAKPFDIKLVNCDITDSTLADKTVTVSFTGGTVASNPTELATAGGTNVAIVVTDQNGGAAVKMDGTPSAPVALHDGDNILHYSAVAKKDATDVVPGDFSAVATFNLSYQ